MPFILAWGTGVLMALGFALQAGRAGARTTAAARLLAGFLGLAAGRAGSTSSARVMAAWATWPAVLINVVFGALFLGAPVPSLTPWPARRVSSVSRS
jgi:hypothetical protein